MANLVTYFSCSGITKGVAEIIAETLNCDVIEIEPEVYYTEADLNWRDKQSRTSLEMNDKNSRPAIKNKPFDTTNLDTIYLGFPVWWYIAPTIVNTFLEGLELENKKIILFATAGSSDFGKTVEFLQNSAKGATIIEGKVFKRGFRQEDVLDWLKSL